MADKKIEEQQHRQYLQKKVNPIMEKLVVDLLKKKPDDVLDFMKIWIDEKGRKYVSELNSSNQQSNVNAYGEHSDDSEDDGDVVELLPKQELVSIQQKKPMRQSVSAEAYGKFNVKSTYQPKVIPKSADQYKRIENKLLQAFMFSALDDKERDIVIKAMEEKQFSVGDVIIKQGDDGDNLYVVDSGQLDCIKQFKGEENPRHLKVYQPGESFGELALLYNAPRAATIVAKTDAVLFQLDRDCFNHIVKDAAAKKRQNYEQLLAKIDILGEVDPYERTQIADALKPIKFKAGEFIVREGDKGDTFYFVEQGQAIALKVLQKGQQPTQVMNYKDGDYFGELALLRDQPRAASIQAQTDISLATLDRNSFKRLLGPLEDLMKRNFSKYQNYLV